MAKKKQASKSQAKSSVPANELAGVIKELESIKAMLRTSTVSFSKDRMGELIEELKRLADGKSK